jgi:ABC-type transport system involved in multi-copper enzyme maturation permease subunit
MTAPATAPYRSDVATGNDGFAQLLRAEWTKFRTVRGWVIGTIVAALVIVLLGILTSAGGQCGIFLPSGKTYACTAPLGPGGEPVTDKFYFVHQPLAGNGSITVRVTSLTGVTATHPGGVGAPGLQPWSKAGIIIKASTRQGSAYAAVMVTGRHGVRMQYDYTQDTPGLAGSVSAASPRWLRLTRSGDTITGYDSADGSHWGTVGTARLAGLPATVPAGLFAASPDFLQVSTHFGGGSVHGGPSVATAAFDHVGLRGAWPNRTWAGTPVTSPVDLAVGGPSGSSVFHQAGGTVTVSGSGDIAPDVGDSSPVTHVLTGAFAGLIAMVVIGTLFITAEYRRGLIRTTFAASPRRGRVLAAKALVVGTVTFAVSLVAALIVIPVGERLLRANGNFVYPLPFLTELRVVAGTAALLAVAAVLAVAIGALLRRSAGAVAAVIAAIILPYLLGVASVLPAGAADWLLRVTPAAAFAIQQTVPAYPQVISNYTPGGGFFPLAPWAGFAVLCAYAAAALGLAAFLLRRRDV